MSETMDFSSALLLLKSGRKIARQGWNGKGMWATIQNPDNYSKNTRSYLVLKAVDGTLGPWTPSNTDILASDWVNVVAEA